MQSQGLYRGDIEKPWDVYAGEDGASRSSPGSQRKMGLGASMEVERVARPLLLAGDSGDLDQGGDNGTGEKWVDFGGSLFPSWCLDSGAWGRVMSDL